MPPLRRQFVAPLAAAAALALAAPAIALPVAERLPQRAAPATGVAVAQLETVRDESAQRRISFYADRVLKSLARLAEDDRLAVETGAATDSATTQRLAENVARLVEACEAAGLSNAEAGQILSAAYNERYEGPPPTPLLAASGGLDAQALVANYGTRAAPATPAPAAGEAYLAAISAAGAQTREERLARVLSGAPADDEVRAVETVSSEPEAPVAIEPKPAPDPEPEPVADVEPGVDPAVAAVLARVQGSGSTRRITVQPGDTLGRIATAVYGDSLQYRRLFDANRSVLSNPDSLRVGLQIYLPE